MAVPARCRDNARGGHELWRGIGCPARLRQARRLRVPAPLGGRDPVRWAGHQLGPSSPASGTARPARSAPWRTWHGMEEISCRRGHKHLTVAVDHGLGWLVWSCPGRKQQTKLARTVQADARAVGACRLKEGLRTAFKLSHAKAAKAGETLDKCAAWARWSRIPAFVKLQNGIVNHRDGILASIEHGLKATNGRIESMNTKCLHAA